MTKKIQSLYDEYFDKVTTRLREHPLSWSEWLYFYSEYAYYLTGLMGRFNPKFAKVYATTIERYFIYLQNDQNSGSTVSPADSGS